MLKTEANSRAGFTIVELLIVIVIIGVLAAIVMNVFAGSQRRARNATVGRNMDLWVDSMFRYAIENQSFPLTSNQTVCLGLGYNNNVGMLDGSCWTRPDGTSVRSENPTIMALFSDYIDTNSPPGNHPITTGGDFVYAGGYYAYNNTITVDGVPSPHYIVYHLEGESVPCIQKGMLLTSAWPALTPSTQGYSYNSNGNTVCRISLPNPETL